MDWYKNRRNLSGGMMFKTADEQIVMLDRTVPGDATKWYVADFIKGHGNCGHWSYEGSTIEPGDLVALIKNPLKGI